MRFESRLRVRAADVEFRMLEGAHRYPAKAGDIVRPWMRRVLATGTASDPSH